MWLRCDMYHRVQEIMKIRLIKNNIKARIFTKKKTVQCSYNIVKFYFYDFISN